MTRLNWQRTTKLGACLAIAASMLASIPAMAEEVAILKGVDLTQSCKIGFSQATMNHPWRVAMTNGNEAWAKEHLPNVKLIVTDGQNDSAKQATDVESLLAQNIDVLMISPLTEAALTPVVKEAMDRNIPVVLLDRKVNTPTTVYLTAQNEPIAAKAANFFVDQLKGKGNIIEIQGTAGASSAIERTRGFENVIAKHPDMKIVAKQNADFLREPSQKFMEDMLQRFGPGQIQGVYAENDEMALGAIQAIEAAGRMNDHIMVTGIDGQNNAIQAVKDGKLFATFTFPYIAPQGIQYAYYMCGHKYTGPKDVYLDSHTITKANVDQWIGKGF